MGSGGLPTGSLTVTARVISVAGQPLANVAIWISGHGPFRTDGNGEITVQNMPSPYEAVVVNGTDATADFWPTLTRPDPVFVLDPDDGVLSGASIDGAVTGGIGWPVPPTHTTRVYITYQDAIGGASATADPATGAYSFNNLTWKGPLAVAATLFGIQFLADVNGDPVSFTGFGFLEIPLLSTNSVLTNQDIVLNPVPTTMITGTMNLPPGMTPVDAVVALRAGGPRFLALPSTPTFLPSFTKFAPVVAGIPRDLVAAATSPESFVFVVRQDLPDPALNIVVDVPAPTGLVLPIDNFTGVDHDTVFQITPTPGGRVFSVRFGRNSGTGPTIILHTTESSFTIPDLSAFGVTIPQGADYNWSVSANGPLDSLDEAAVAPTSVYFTPVFSNGTGDPFTATTPHRDFTFGQ